MSASAHDLEHASLVQFVGTRKTQNAKNIQDALNLVLNWRLRGSQLGRWTPMSRVPIRGDPTPPRMVGDG